VTRSTHSSDRVIPGPGLADFHGDLLRLGDPDYHSARQVFNGMIDRRPALIARCAGTDDIRLAIRVAVERGYRIAVRGGGHSVGGQSMCDDGMVIDLSGLREVIVDPDRRVAHAQPGATWRDLDAAAGRVGLATPGGVISTTGIAGFTLGGGVGWLSRRFGMTCDNLVGAQLALPDGDMVEASEDVNPEVLWGLRGGGGNFGAVTGFDFALHDIKSVVGGIAAYDINAAEAVVAHYRSRMDAADDELASILDFATADDGSGRQLVTIIACCSKADENGTAQVRDVLAVPAPGVQPVTSLTRRFRYPLWQRILDHTAPAGRLNYWKTVFLTELGAQAITTISELGHSRPSPWSRIHVIRMGGRASRQAAGASAFSARHHPYLVHLITAWSDPADTERCVGWTKDAFERLQPYAAEGAYLNFVEQEGDPQIRASFGEETYDRLVQLKDRLDPANRFSLNQNIVPSGLSLSGHASAGR
jgi:FAD/FMN-containing dehydrogenase